MSECAPKAAVVHGDARLTLQKVEKPFELIFLDAFSSDSIPAHLVTVEAIQSYLEKLSPGGAIVLHVSNRHLDLRAIVARAAAEAGLITYAEATEGQGGARAASVSLVVGRTREDLGDVAHRWTLIQPETERAPWTDDYSNVLEGIRDAWLGPKADKILIRSVQSADAQN